MSSRHPGTLWTFWILGPVAEVALTAVFTSCTSSQVGALMLNSTVGADILGKALWGCSSWSHQSFSGCCAGPGLPPLRSRKGGPSKPPTTALLSHSSSCKAQPMVGSFPHLPPQFFCFSACATSDRSCLVFDSWCSWSGGLTHFHQGPLYCKTDNNCGHHLEPLVCVILCCGFYGSGCSPFELVPLTALACWRPHNLY